MAFTYYTSADASAPVLTGAADSLIALLDAILVNGYGSKGAAGWTKPYNTTNVAVYRMATGAGKNGHYLRVNDADAQEARWLGYEVMTAHSTGTGDFPTNGQVSGGLYMRKSATADATARPWRCVADDTAIVLQVYSNDTTLGASAASSNVSMLFGQGDSYVSGDAYFTACIGRTADWSTTPGDRFGDQNNSFATYSANTGHFLCRASSQAGSSVSFSKAGNANFSGGGCGTTGWTYPVPATGKLMFTRMLACELTGASGTALRGALPGMYLSNCGITSLNPGDTFTGSGSIAGKDFAVLTAHSISASVVGRVIVQTSGAR